MRSHRLRLAAVVGSASLLFLGLAAGPASAHSMPKNPSPHHTTTSIAGYHTVANGLNNPRDLVVDRSGTLYVAEAGSGGPESASCFVASAGARVCPGNTSSITQVTTSRNGRTQQRRVVTGLPSLAPPPGADGAGTEAAGADALVVTGRHYTVSIGFGAGCEDGGTGPDPTCNPTADHHLSRLFGTVATGTLGSRHAPRVLANLATHEYRTNPIDTPDSNPVSLARDRGSYLVADAGANSIQQVSSRGHVSTVASFPDVMTALPGSTTGAMIPMQFVPTSAVRGPDGALYVSQLTGFPFPKGGSTIWRIARGHAPTPYATGLTNVTNLTFAPDGSMYAVEISTTGLLDPTGMGALVHIPRHGGTATVVAGSLPAPYDVALAGRTAYVTVNSSTAATGAVIAVPLSRRR